MSGVDHFRVRQFIVNLLTNLTLLGVNIGGTLILVPVMIKGVGVEDYSYFPLVMIFSQGLVLVISALTNVFGNFYSVALRKDESEALKIFSTCNLALVFMIVFLIPIILIVTLNIEHIINVKATLVNDVKFLYILTALSTLVQLLDSGISTVTFSLNRLDLKNISQISNKVILIGGTVGLIWIGLDRVYVVGLSMLVGTIVGLSLSVYYWRKLAPAAIITFAYFDKKILKTVSNTCFWVLINQVGSVFLLQLDLYFINLYWAGAAGGVYGVIAQAVIAVRTLASTVVWVFLPRATHLLAVSTHKEIAEYISAIEKSLAVFLGFTIALLISYSSEILTLWVGADFARNTLPFDVMLALPLPSLIAMPSFSMFPLMNKIRVPGLVTLGFSLVNVAALVALGFYDGRQPLFVPIIGGVILMMKNVVFVPIYFASLFGCGVTRFLLSQVIGVGVALLTYFLSRGVSYVVAPVGIVGLLANFVVMTLLCMPLFWGTLPGGERIKALKFIRGAFP
jgi:membrane protein EpsK